MSLEDLVNDATGTNSQDPSEPDAEGTLSPERPLDSPAPVTEDPTEGSPVNPAEEPTPTSEEVPLETGDEALSRLADVTESQSDSNTGETSTDSAQESIVDGVQAGDPILDAILNKIVPVKSKNRRRKLKVLIYSDPGCGKSVLAGTAPNNLFVDCEDGLISLDNHPDLVPDTVYAYPYKSFMGFEAVVRKLNEAPPELEHIKTVTIDTISELHKRGLAEVVEREWEKSPSVNNRYVAETDHHTENNEHIRRLVSSLRDLDRNLILLSHGRTVEPKNRPAKTFPDFSEKLANTLAGIVDIVAYMYLKEVDGEVVRVLQLQGDGQIVAKTRIGGYPHELVNPTWDTLWEVFTKASERHEAQKAAANLQPMETN